MLGYGFGVWWRDVGHFEGLGDTVFLIVMLGFGGEIHEKTPTRPRDGVGVFRYEVFRD